MITGKDEIAIKNTRNCQQIHTRDGSWPPHVDQHHLKPTDFRKWCKLPLEPPGVAAQRFVRFFCKQWKKNIYDTNHVIARYIYQYFVSNWIRAVFRPSPNDRNDINDFPFGFTITMGYHITIYDLPYHYGLPYHHRFPWVTISPWVPMGIYDLPHH